MGDTLSTGGKGAQGDFDGGGAGLVDAGKALSLIVPFGEALALFACLSAFAPSLRTVGFGPTEVTGLGIILGISLEIEACSAGGEGGFGPNSDRLS